MGEEKPRSLMHTCAICGRVAAALSIVLLVPVVRKQLAKRHEKKHVVDLKRFDLKRFPIFGH
jgi:hypothetical protein